MRTYQVYIWLVLASLFLHISTVATRRSSSSSSSSRSSSSSSSRSSSGGSWRSNSSPSYSSRSSYSPSSSSHGFSWGSSSRPSHSSSSSSSSSISSIWGSSWGSTGSPSSSSISSIWGSSWGSTGSPSYSSSPSSTNYGFSRGSSSSPSYTSSGSWLNIGSPSSSSNSRSWLTTGTSSNSGSSSTTNLKPSGRSWGNTETTKSNSDTSGSGVSSSISSYKPSSRSPSYSSRSSSSSGPSSSSSKNEDSNRNSSKDKGTAGNQIIPNYSPSSSSSKNENNYKNSNKDKGTGDNKMIPNYSPSSSGSSSSKNENSYKNSSKDKGTGDNKSIPNYSASSSSKMEGNNKSDSKAISSGARKSNSNNTPNSNSNTNSNSNAESSITSSHRSNSNINSRTIFDAIRNRNIIRNTTASGYNSNTSQGAFYRSPHLNQTVFNNPSNPSGSIVQNLNTMPPLHATINLNNNHRSAIRRPYYGDTYHSYSNYGESSLETPAYSPEDDSNDRQSSYSTTEWLTATEKRNYLPIDKVPKPIETEKVCRNVIQGEYNERDVYVENVKKICEPKITTQLSSSIVEATTSPTAFIPTPYALQNEGSKAHMLSNSPTTAAYPASFPMKASDASIIKQQISESTNQHDRAYGKIVQSELNERNAIIESIKEICEAELASTTTQTPVETTTMPPTSTAYFIDYKNRKPSKLVIMPPLEGVRNCRKVMKSDLNEEGQIVDIVEQICDPPTATESTKADSLTVVKALPNTLNVLNKNVASDEPHSPDSMHGSKFGHEQQVGDAIENICRKITQMKLSERDDALFTSIKEICEADFPSTTTQIPVETTTMPPTSTTYFTDYKYRKPSKLIIMPPLEGATNCRKIMNSEFNEEGQIVDTVTQICDPPTTTETTTTTADPPNISHAAAAVNNRIPQALKVSNEQQERVSTSINNSAHRKQDSNPLKIICGKIIQSQVKEITGTPLESTTVPIPTSTIYYIDYKNRKPSKLVILPTLVGATNCRKVMNSELSEKGEIVDTVAEICEPLSTSTTPTVTVTSSSAATNTVESLISVTMSPV